MIASMARLRVLDEVTWDGKPVPGERTHALLRALVEAGSRGLGEQTLVDEIWLEDPPANPTKALQVVVSRARAATATAAIERTSHGYRLALAPAEVDAWSLRPDALRLAAEGRYAEALPLLDQLDRSGGPDRPGDEEALAARLRATAAVRGTPAALDAYEAYREQLADRLGVDPAPRLQELHRELLARDTPVRAGLRFDADEMIGRDADVAALATLVRSHRLVSVVGAGGLGKTRLAHLMGRLAEQPVVHFVELVSVTSDAGVAVEVADALGAREAVSGRRSSLPPRSDPISRVVELVGTVPTLLILDNCEQVVEGVADLVSALLARTPALTVLTTTRIPLGLAAERVYLLPELTRDDAAALFGERARAARPGVVLDPDRVLALVSRLDGLPLAVELAAAKVRVMSVPEIERRLENRFALLRGGARDAPERHQTLLAVIDWSWNLLAEPERIALRRLSVFRDGFSLDGASAVLGQDALDVLISLVEQSLVVVGEDATLRYRLLETVREFGRMQLVDAGDDEETGGRLRSWAILLAEHARRRLFTTDQIEVMATVRAEEGNLVDLLRQAQARGDVEAVAALLGVLAGFWSVEGSHLKIVNVAGPAAPLLYGPTPPGMEDAVRAALSATVLNEMIFGGLAGSAGCDRLRALGPDSQDSHVRAVTTVLLTLLSVGDPAASDVRMLHEADEASAARLAELAASPDRETARWALMWNSQLAENSGDLVAARETAERSLALAEDSDGPWGRALVQAHLAGLLLQMGEREPARRYAEAAEPVMAALGAVEDWAQCRSLVALVDIAQGRFTEAARILDELGADERVQSVFGGAISQLCGRAELCLAQGRTQEGLAAYREAVAVLRAKQMPALGPDGFAPWLLFPQSASVAAHCRAGCREDVAADRAELLSMGAAWAGDGRSLDYPILGGVLYALAAWELTGGDPDAGVRLSEYAAALSYNRMLPSLDPVWLDSLVAATGLPARDLPRAGLRQNVAAYLAQLISTVEG
jgi:predicted ATPase/tetratricopeptide (TPR) repeat protein/DNA-binding SARP family transcriptional activator